MTLGPSASPEPDWASDHPVLDLLRRRRQGGSRPGERTDGASVALCVEGGGMRGVVSAAMLSAIEDLGYAETVDAVYGGSSGSLNAAYFLAGDMWRSLSIYYDHLVDRRFLDLTRPLRGRPVLDVDWAFDHVVDRAMPLDLGGVLAAPVPLHVSLSLVDEIRVEIVSDFRSAADLREALRAGAWLPVATSGTARFRGRRALDGGALVSHPVRMALTSGHTDVLSLSTRPAGARSAGTDLVQRWAARRLDHLRPGFGRAFLAAHRQGVQDRDMLDVWRRAPSSGPSVLDLCPPAGTRITRLEMNPTRLLAAARDSYEVMVRALSGRPGRDCPRFLADIDPDHAGHRGRGAPGSRGTGPWAGGTISPRRCRRAAP